MVGLHHRGLETVFSQSKSLKISTRWPLEYNDGSRYFGEVYNGKAHGKGTKVWSDGAQYVREFKDDAQNGEGTLTDPKGSGYKGAWKDGDAYGKGE